MEKKKNKKTGKEKAAKEIVIDATNNSLGRLATFAAKQISQGNKVAVVNIEKAIIIGKPKNILQDYLHRYRLGHGAQKGPILSRTPTAICRRAIRGMINWKKAKGKQAFRLVKCYEGVPKNYEKAEKFSFPKRGINFITLGELCKLIKQK